jgi:hypothetical protein
VFRHIEHAYDRCELTIARVPSPDSESVENCDPVGLLLLRRADVETVVTKRDDVTQSEFSAGSAMTLACPIRIIFSRETGEVHYLEPFLQL